MSTPTVQFKTMAVALAAICVFIGGCKKPVPATMTLAQAIQNDNAGQVNANLDASATIDAKDDSGMPLIVLAAGRSNDVLKALLSHKPALGVSDDRTGMTSLHAAAMKYDGSANVRLLLAGGADFKMKDKQGRTPLFLAAESGDVESVKALIEAGSDVNAPADNGLTPLDTAEAHRDTAKDPNVVEYLKSKAAQHGVAKGK